MPKWRMSCWPQARPISAFRTQDEIEAFREAGPRRGNIHPVPVALARCDPRPTIPTRPMSIRIKAPREGQTTLHRRQVQGDVTSANDQLDDMILLRSDGTPVYMLAVVVDDHDMGVTHVIRGDDHLPTPPART